MPQAFFTAPLAVFKTAALNHSATLPRVEIVARFGANHPPLGFQNRLAISLQSWAREASHQRPNLSRKQATGATALPPPAAVVVAQRRRGHFTHSEHILQRHVQSMDDAVRARLDDQRSDLENRIGEYRK